MQNKKPKYVLIYDQKTQQFKALSMSQYLKSGPEIDFISDGDDLFILENKAAYFNDHHY